MDNNSGKIILSLSIPLSILITLVSCISLLTPDFYVKETFNWRIQSVGQDMIDLFIVVPALIITAMLAYRKKYIADLLWAGVMLYILYTFLIYSFGVHFNRLFLIYCLTLGLSFYSLAWFIYSQIKSPVKFGINKNAVVKVTGIFFLVLSFVFYFLWLSEIIPAVINNRVPKGVTETGLVTNPVQVIDLSVFLPGIFITGFWILKRRPAGFSFAIIILTFFVLMNVTIGWLALMMKRKELESSLSVTIVMAVLSLISFVFLVWNIKHIKIRTP
ncbi:hypothetical protein A3860_26665 [Niastella vici]|uniref:Uncharacterized protein n=1 Tax=Niastella vici TaxID=1703345 RepID=A0A1V9FX21_9BACT|nr:hypothetical protein [Niastella vici]OQP62895.1 hypothetical protein A3860_26665 [Niastella vici]